MYDTKKTVKGFEDFLACKSQSLLSGNFKEDTHNFGRLYKQEGLKNIFNLIFKVLLIRLYNS